VVSYQLPVVSVQLATVAGDEFSLTIYSDTVLLHLKSRGTPN
jgi:hypothetical protein